MRSLAITALFMLLALLAAIGCQSMYHKDGRSRWLPPPIISTDQWWGDKEMGDVGN
jgi:hypothetical protein